MLLGPWNLAGAFRLLHQPKAVLLVVLIAVAVGLVARKVREKLQQVAAVAEVRRFCGECHLYPKPDTLPAADWENVICQMYRIVESDRRMAATAPAIETALDFYRQNAPAEFPALERSQPELWVSSAFQPVSLDYGSGAFNPQVASVLFVRHSDRTELLVCDGGLGLVLHTRFTDGFEPLRALAEIPTPCRLAPIDLDRDGLEDYLVASIGDFAPSDVRNGKVLWLRRHPKGGFRALTLIEGLGRVADVQAADFDEDGDLDLIVAVFGWRAVGQVLYLENVTTDWENPQFEPVVVDGRPGALAVPIVDLNGDGRPDFVTALAQQFETVIAFVNRTHGYFESSTLYTAEHPAWGTSGIEVIDFDGDGDWDLLVTNGDTLDDFRLKPYHGVCWLENRGGMSFAYHRLCHLPAAYVAKAGDLDGDGDLDVVAAAFYSPQQATDLERLATLDSLIWLEQTTPGTFKRHAIETGWLVHPTLDLADFDKDGDLDIAVGNWAGGAYGLADKRPAGTVTIYENRIHNRPGAIR